MKLRWPLRLGLVRLSLLAVVVGLVTSLGAVLFRDLIGLIHNVTFLGIFSFDYDASVFTPPSPWGAPIILVPVVGGQIGQRLQRKRCIAGRVAALRRAGGARRDAGLIKEVDNEVNK